MGWKHRFHQLLHRDDRDRELAEEMRLHVEMRAEEFRAAGMSEREALRAARKAFGSSLQFAEESRRHWLPRWMDELRQDIGFALRSFAANRGFIATMLLTMALGIGANTAVFSLVEAVMLRRLPIPEPDGLVEVTAHLQEPGRWNSNNDDSWGLSYPLFREIAGAQQSFSCLYGRAHGLRSYVDSGSGPWEIRPRVHFVSACYFEAMGVKPLLGRGLVRADVKGDAAEPVAVLSHATWRGRFSSDPQVVGRSLTVGSAVFEIVGVMPEGFVGDSPAEPADFWLPLESFGGTSGFASWNDRGSTWFTLMGRLRPDVDPQRAAAELTALLRSFVQTDLADWRKHNPSTKTQPEMFRMELQDGARGFNELRRQYQQALHMLLGLVTLLLLLACLNVAGLLTARGVARSHEVSVRLSLGASRARVVRQLLLENLVLCAFGAALGLGVAHWFSLQFVSLVSKATVPLELPYQLNESVLLYTMVVTLVAALVSGLLPAWQTANTRLSMQLAAAGRNVTQHRSRLRWNRSLVVAQVSLGVMLVSGAGLMLRSLYGLSTQPVGFDVERVLVAFLERAPANVASSKRSTLEVQSGRAVTLRARLQALPGVQSTSLANMAPLSGWMMSTTVHGSATSTGRTMALQNHVGAGYFETLGTPLIAGRFFSPEDHASQRKVCVIDEDLAKALFPDRTASGERISAGREFNPKEALEVIGITQSNRWFGPKQDGAMPFRGMLWTTLEQAHRPFLVALLRTSGDPQLLAPAVRQAMREEMPELLVTNTAALERLRDDTLQQERILAVLCTGFGVLALVMVFAGLHGLLAYTVERRIPELGIRMAMGATRAHLRRLVGNESLRLVLLGLVVGIPAALLASRLIGGLLWVVKPSDPFTHAVTLVVIAIVGLLAAALPARRAASVSPTDVLRSE